MEQLGALEVTFFEEHTGKNIKAIYLDMPFMWDYLQKFWQLPLRIFNEDLDLNVEVLRKLESGLTICHYNYSGYQII